MQNEPACLLVVEDDETIRSLLGRYLQARGFQVTGVADGEGALTAVASGGFDLVLLDSGLPGIGGLEVLRRLRSTCSLTDLPVIMATAQGRSSDVVEALHLGANDYLTKPFDFAVVLARIQTQLSLKRSVEQIARLEQSLSRRNAELEEANRRMRQDLEAAALVQQTLLPDGPVEVPGAQFAWRFRPCAHLAGDLLNVLVLDERHVALYVLDVVGHGVKAALLTVMVNRLLAQLLTPAAGRPRAVRQRKPSPAEVALHLNQAFPWDDRTEQYFSLLYGVLDLGTGDFVFASAGHPGPIYVAASGPAQAFDTPGAPIGLEARTYKESCITLQPGDRLYLYTDGLPEAFGPDRVFYGRERLLRAVEEGRELPLQDSVAGLLRQVEQWCGPVPPHDDISILAVQWDGAAPARQSGSAS